ncbi:MAG: hypothetical protein MUC44_06225 [Beijerinckiaceae bacterium]|nr:hypothetical protein [Beijerinckiaceae bacterium]
MFARLDDACLALTNRLARHLQEDLGLTMPVILRQVATATIVATVLAVVAAALLRGPLILAITLLFGVITVAAYGRLLKRYAHDAEKDWNSDLARDYMVRAIGAMEGQRQMREFGLLFALIGIGFSFAILQFRRLDLVDFTMFALILSTMAHMYLSCAEPRPPGSRRRKVRLALQNSGA